MVKFLASIMLALSMFSCAPAYAMDAAKAAKIQDEIVSTSFQYNEKCSATAIYSDRAKDTGKVTTIFLTAKHCADGDTNKRVVLKQSTYDKVSREVKITEWVATVKGVFYKADLALLEASDHDTVFKTIEVAPKEFQPAPLSDAVLSGYPVGLQLTITEGNIGYRESIPFPKENTDTEYLRASPALVGGNSGGGLFVLNGDHYQLVGVASAGLRSAPHIGFYTPHDLIQEYISTAIVPVNSPKVTPPGPK